jgi:DNA-binding transcriptional ArsR family regulator
MVVTECDANVNSASLLPSDDVLEESVRLLKGFADLTRLRILCLLRYREVCVHEIVEAMNISQSGVSHQLRLLRDARLVASRKQGRHVFYRLADKHVKELLENAISHGAEGS